MSDILTTRPPSQESLIAKYVILTLNLFQSKYNTYATQVLCSKFELLIYYLIYSLIFYEVHVPSFFQIKVGYHETMTLFFASVIDEAIRKCQQADVTFEEFISQNQHLVDKNLVLRYYSREQIMSDEARKR